MFEIYKVALELLWFLSEKVGKRSTRSIIPLASSSPPNAAAPLLDMADTNTELVPQDPNHAIFDQIGIHPITLLQGDLVEAGVVYPTIKNRIYVLTCRFITVLKGNPFLAEAAKPHR